MKVILFLTHLLDREQLVQLQLSALERWLDLELELGEYAEAVARLPEVIADGGSQPSQAMIAWANELQLGNWFSLDHSGKVTQVQYVWRSERKQLHLFAAPGGRSYLLQLRRLASYLQAGLLLPAEEETLTVRATRDALAVLSLLGHKVAEHILEGGAPRALNVPAGSYQTSDGWMMVTLVNEPQYKRLCAAIGRDDLATDRITPTRRSAKTSISQAIKQQMNSTI